MCRGSAGIGSRVAEARLCGGLADQTDAHLVVRKIRRAVGGPVDEPAFDQGLRVGMRAVEVSSQAMRRFALLQRSCAGERLEDAPAVRIQRRQQRFRAVESLSTPLRLAAKGGL